MEGGEALLLRRAVIKAHIRFVHANGSPVTLCCLHFPKEGAAWESRFEEALAFLEEETDFSSLLLWSPGTVAAFVKEVHLHRSLEMLRAVRERIETQIGLKVGYGALTTIDSNDTYDRLEARLERYLAQAAERGEGRICYGTVRYDFCAKGGEEEIFRHFFRDVSRVTLFNFYNGMPLSEEVEVLGYSEEVLRVRTSLAKAAFLQSEPFTFIRHPLLPDTLKADILGTRPTRAEVSLGNLRFIDKSPLDRENIRVMPDETIEAVIECPAGGEIMGVVHALAVNSVAIRPDSMEIADACLPEGQPHATLLFDLPEGERRISHLRLSATLLYRKEDQLIFSIYPNHFYKQKIEGYIALQQTRLITIMQKMVLNFYQG